jgi:hypothetical protein
MRIIIKVLDTNGRKLQGIYCDCSLSQREAFADAKVTATRGFDFDTLKMIYYGGNIYKDYDEKSFDSNVKVGQGNKTAVLLIFKEVI